jgi:CheY-like chemotaxis protein
LIVEDDEDVRQIYSHWLRQSGFDVTEAKDGPDALEIIGTSRLPDVIVLDLRLPTLDGVAVRNRLAAHEDTARIPVIVITATTGDLAELNAAAILRKPVTFESLVDAVRTATVDGTRF